MKYLFTLTLCFLSLASIAQEIIVKDELTRQPIELVNIVSYDLNQVLTTDVKGRADLSEIGISDSVVLSLVGYEKKRINLDELAKDEPTEIFLTPGAFALDELVVSAARWKQDKRDIPTKVVTISPQDVALQNPQTAADLLARSGQVYVQKSQLGGGSPMIRGFSTNRVMLNVDGIRMNNAIFRSGNLQNVISLDPFAIENTEVVYGPGSVIYGSDAIGGVMSFYTLTPRLSKTDELLVDGNANVRSSSANFEKTGHFDINIANQKWGFTTSATVSDYDDLRMGSFGPVDYLRYEYADRVEGRDTVFRNPDPRVQIPTGYSQLNLMQKVRFKPNEHWDFVYGGHYSTTTDYTRFDRLQRYRNDQLRSAEWYYGPQEWMMHSLRIENDQRNFFYDKLSVTGAYQYFRESRHDRDFGSDIRTNRVERVYAYSLNIDLEQDIGERHELFYGAEVVLNEVGSKGMDKNIIDGTTYGAPSRYPDGSLWNSNAVYFTERFRINEKFTLLGGARYNLIYLESQFDTTYYDFSFTSTELLMDAVIGSMGVAYKPNSKWQINANLSTGFRAPNIDDIGKVFDSEPGSVVIPNPDLSSEYAYNAEVGVTKIFGEALKVDATVFYTILENALVRRNYTLNGSDSILYDGDLSQIQAIQNAARATVYGIQTGFEAKLPFGLGLSARLNFQDGEEELDDGTVAPLRHAAPMFGIARLMYTRQKLKLELNAEYNAEIKHSELAPSELEKDYIYAFDDNGQVYSPEWYTLNFRLLYSLNDNLSFSGGIENILDLRYRPYSSGISAPGRNFIGMLKLSF